MQSNVENLGALERRLSVSVPHEIIETEMENRLKRLARTAKIPGFRPGKVPLKIVLQQYGPQVRQEVLGDVLQKSFSEVVRERKLRIAGSPRFEPKAAAESAAEFEFSATFEVYPDVVLGDMSAVSVEQPVVKVVPADVDKTLEVVRKQRVQYQPAERPAVTGDRANIDYRGVIDGVEFAGGKAEGFTLVLGEGHAALKDNRVRTVQTPGGHRRVVDRHLTGDEHAQLAALRRDPVVEVGRLQERLGRDAAPVEAGAADLVLVDESHAETELRPAEGGRVAAGAGAEHDEVERVGRADGHGRCLRKLGWRARTAQRIRPMVPLPRRVPAPARKRPRLLRRQRLLPGAWPLTAR